MSAKAPGSDAQLRFYHQTLAEGVDEAQQVGWESVGLQRLRFEALLEAVAPADLQRPGVRLLDVGCGLGALFGHLQATGRANVDYTGIDLSLQMIERAQSLYPGGRFVCADMAEFSEKPFDIVLCCGGFSIRPDNDPTARTCWQRIQRLLDLARWCVTLNLQAKQPGEGDTDQRFWLVDPSAAWRRLSRMCERLSLRSDVLPGELLVHLYPGEYTRVMSEPAYSQWASAEDRAEAWLQQDNFGAVVRTLGSTPKVSPRAACLLGIALSHLDDPRGALGLLRQAHALRPADLDCAENLLRLLLDQGARAEALERLGVTLRAAGGAPPAARDALRLLVHESLTVARERALAARLARDAETKPAKAWMLARVAFAARAPDAPTRYRAAAKAQPWDVSLALELASCLIAYEHHAEAKALLASILRFDPREPTAKALLRGLPA